MGKPSINSKPENMSKSKLHKLIGITLATIFLISIPYQVCAATKGNTKSVQSDKERLVLMPLRVPEEDKNLLGAMEAALVEGLHQQYDVFSGEQVSQKARQIFLKESRNMAHTVCDETRCMQNIAEAFQSELIATANVTKQDGTYFLALSIQNIFDNKVVYSKSLPCEKCSQVQVIFKLKVLSGAGSDAEVDDAALAAARKAKAEQLKQEQMAFEEKLRNAGSTERKRLLDAKAADDKHLAEIKASVAARHANSNSQPTTFPSFEQALTELAQLKDKIATIEAGYEKELDGTRNKVNQRYSETLDVLKNEKRDEFDSVSEFQTKQDKKRNEIIAQRDVELARLNASRVAATETAPLKVRINALNQHEYIVGAEGIEAVLGEYDAEGHQFPITVKGKTSTLKLQIEGSVPLQGAEAKAFKQQWQSGLIRPEAKVSLAGDVKILSLFNDSDNNRLINYSGRFITNKPAAAASVEELTGIMVNIPNKNYEMGKYDVTQAQWLAVMGNNPSKFTSCGLTCPVEQVSWRDVQEFIQVLNTKTGKQYRLPTEKEWGYACYGYQTEYYCGGDDPKSVAWYSENSQSTTHPVGQKQANGYGLYDMSGNVWQWMENKYDNEHDWRALRGGSWGNGTHDLGASIRNSFAPNLADDGIGFRLARTLP
jgi:hypothetical protein